MISWKPADRVLELDVLARGAGEDLGHVERLREEALHLAGAGDRQPVLVGQLLDAEDRDDVLEVLVALEDLLHARRGVVVLVGDDPAAEGARGRVERVDRRVDPLLDERPREHGRRVEVGERVRRRRVGEVVGGDVDRLHRGDRALARRGDPLLELPHLGRERRLVADGARHAAEQRRDLGARLDEAEDVVDEEQHVLALVAEVLGHRQAGQADAEARSRRLVHLAVAERDLRECTPTPPSPRGGRCPRGCARRRPRTPRRRRARGRGSRSAPGSAPSCRRRRRRRGRSCRRARTVRSGRRP